MRYDGGTEGKSVFLSALMVMSVLLAGCVAFESTVNPRAVLQAYPLFIQEGETITLDARDSEAVEGVITDSNGILVTEKPLKP